MTEATATGAGTAATTAATGGSTAANTATGGTPDWTSGLSDEAKGYVQNKNFDSPKAVVESYINLEKMARGDPNTLLRLPGKDAKPEDWAPVWDKLGRPADAKGYELAVPEGGDPKFAEWAAGTFHEIGVPKSQAQALTAKWNEKVAEMTKAQETARSEANALEATKLKTEWGAGYDKQIEVAKRAALGLGVDAKTIDALEASMGYAGVMKFFNSLGAKMGEAEFVGGDGKGNFGAVSTPEAAKAKIAELRKDTGFTARYVAGDVAAKAELERLHKLAYPDAS